MIGYLILIFIIIYWTMLGIMRCIERYILKNDYEMEPTIEGYFIDIILEGPLTWIWILNYKMMVIFDKFIKFVKGE